MKLAEILLAVLFWVLFTFNAHSQTESKPLSFQPNWTSLRTHQIPQWLVDAKFGIYCHWGIQTISYQKGKEELSNDKLISLFNGEKFNKR